MTQDLTGQTIGRWHVLENLGVIKRSAGRVYRCRCNCGVTREVRACYLLNGASKSCGCYSADRSVTHGATRGGKQTPTFQSWTTMARRCYTPTVANYAFYGGRGIKVCARWRGREGFANFLADMGERPEGASLDRINPNGNYEPSNCRWANAKEQGATRRNSRERIRSIIDRELAALKSGPQLVDRDDVIRRLQAISAAICD
jgi:hypothetical protein